MVKKTANIIIMVLISFCFLYFFLKSVQWEHMLDYLVDVDMKYLIAFILLTPLHLVTRAIRWNYLLVHEKPDISFFSRFAANAVGFTVTYILPGRLGELVKPVYLARKENMKNGFVLGTVVVERMFDIFTICFLLGLFFVLKPFYPALLHVSDQACSYLYVSGIISVVFVLMMLFFVLLLYFHKDKALFIILFVLKPFSKKITLKIELFLNEFISGLNMFHSLRNLNMYIFWSLIVWVSIIANVWGFFTAFNIFEPFFLYIPFTFLLLIGASIPTPGMVGGFHYFSKLGMISLFNIDPNLAVGMTMVLHAVQLSVTCMIGFYILWKEGVSLLQVAKL